jgi:Fic family protein
MTTPNRIIGTYAPLGQFVPYGLPPKDSSLQMDAEMLHLYGEAMHALGRLNEMLERVPDSSRFLKAYVMKEALLSSEIEGIQTTLADVFTGDYAKVNKPTQLILNYSKALEEIIWDIRRNHIPLSTRLLRKAHQLLLTDGAADPGEFRKQQVQVGDLLPPPANEIPGLMSDLEKFLHNDTTLPPLIKAGLAHVQFETIHPFLDGNGRIGRLLIVLILVAENLLQEPLLYPSYYFKKRHAEYYARLDAVRVSGDWEGWIKFYLRGIGETAHDALERARDIETLQRRWESKITRDTTILSGYLYIKALNCFFHRPVLNITDLARDVGVSYNSAKTMVQKFLEMGVIQQQNEFQRNKLYQLQEYLKILDKRYRM